MAYQWEMLELAFTGTTEPWVVFTSDTEEKRVRGFWDGGSSYRVRFLPMRSGRYAWRREGTDERGRFEAMPARSHGPVGVRDQYWFQYADGSPYQEIGTTCYVWELQDDRTISQTLESLERSPFNKVRFCLLPKHYYYNYQDPRMFPFPGTPVDARNLNQETYGQYGPESEGNHWDFSRVDPAYWRHVDHCVERLGELGIQADLILFHPYDRWGFSRMGREYDDAYTRYVVSRYAAYPHVWWSLANEWDLCRYKDVEDWNRLGRLVRDEDPYGHLRSIHNWHTPFDPHADWITHASVQRWSQYDHAQKTRELRASYQKPVVMDEVGYEENLMQFWGSLPASEMVNQFWLATVRGGYCGHSETFEGERIWWSHGGVLKGESYKRLFFLKQFLEHVPGGELEPARISPWGDNSARAAKFPDSFLVLYADFHTLGSFHYRFPEQEQWRVTQKDVWEMTSKDLGVHSGWFHIRLEGKPWQLFVLERLA